MFWTCTLHRFIFRVYRIIPSKSICGSQVFIVTFASSAWYENPFTCLGIQLHPNTVMLTPLLIVSLHYDWVKILMKINSREESFILVHILRISSPSWQEGHGGRCLRQLVFASVRKERAMIDVQTISFLVVQAPSDGIVLPTFREGLPTSVNLI